MAELRSFVVGGAGFIGSHLVDRLVRRGPVTVFDDLSVGKRQWLEAHLATRAVELLEADAIELDKLVDAMRRHAPNVVFHLSANPEARWGLEHTRLDLEQGTIVTYNVLEAMRRCDVKRIVFASSGTVYGDTTQICREEDLGCLPISLYGASKLASEAMVSAFVECFGLQAWILRFGNVIGPRATHGCALDFLRKLQQDPQVLEVLGDGKQAKPYLHVSDCVEGMLYVLDRADEPLNVFNLAPIDVTTVARIAELCVAASPHPSARIRFSGGKRGWPGDVPRSRMAPAKLNGLGFSVALSSDAAVERAVGELAREVFGDE